MMNRQQRRAGQAHHKRALKRAIFDEWEDMTAEALGKEWPISMGTLNGFHKNSIYSVQTYLREDGMLLAGVRRHDQGTDCPWAHKQRIKNELFGKSSCAVEVFPPCSELVDDANIYWLWVYPLGRGPGFSLMAK